MQLHLENHMAAEATILVVDGSRTARLMLQKILKKELPSAEVVLCGSVEEARQQLALSQFDLVCLALVLPDGDGLELAHEIRNHPNQRYIPVIVVSGDVTDRVAQRALGNEVTDYFDKSLGFSALANFIHAYVCPDDQVPGKVLYVEDSRVVAVTTKRMLQGNGFEIEHTITAEEALEKVIESMGDGPLPAYDLVLTDVYLKGSMTGKDLMEKIRIHLGLDRNQLPMIVMTGDDDADKQRELLQAGANDLVVKPVEERVLVCKLRFQLNLHNRDKQHLA